jgi:hypothetical protein
MVTHTPFLLQNTHYKQLQVTSLSLWKDQSLSYGTVVEQRVETAGGNSGWKQRVETAGVGWVIRIIPIS